MAGNAPVISDVRLAIDLYLEQAYGPAPQPRAVADAVGRLRAVDETEVLRQPCWERDRAEPCWRYSLRLGNRFYPHMKMLLERRPDGLGYVFRVDTHDHHVARPLDGIEAHAFDDVLRADAEIADAIQAAWEQRGLPTVKTFLTQHFDAHAVLQARPHPEFQGAPLGPP